MGLPLKVYPKVLSLFKHNKWEFENLALLTVPQYGPEDGELASGPS